MSLYEIQAGTEPDDVKADQLAQVLVEIVSAANARDPLRRTAYSRDPEQFLTEDSLRFLGSAEYLARVPEGQSTLEWAGAIIGLCKAAERELLERFPQPLQGACSLEELADELDDPDLGSFARWVAGKVKPPELGTLRHGLITVANSKRRVGSSVVIKLLHLQSAKWPRDGWLLDPEGLAAMLGRLTNYRNAAAHLGSLGPDDYRSCRALVIGNDGLVWRLIDATT